jgi:hypothetical protein
MEPSSMPKHKPVIAAQLEIVLEPLLTRSHQTSPVLIQTSLSLRTMLEIYHVDVHRVRSSSMETPVSVVVLTVLLTIISVLYALTTRLNVTSVRMVIHSVSLVQIRSLLVMMVNSMILQIPLTVRLVMLLVMDVNKRVLNVTSVPTWVLS